MKPADFDENAARLKEQYQHLASSRSQPYAARIAAAREFSKPELEIQAELDDIPPNTPDKQKRMLSLINLEKKIAAGNLRRPYLAFLLGGEFGNDFAQLIQTDARNRTRLQGAKALVALRRWYTAHGDPPPDFTTMCREAGLTELPRDFFGDSPLRMVSFRTDTPIQNPYQANAKAVAGETIIYSLGPDGIDNGAVKDWNFGTGQGDFLFRLEASQSRFR